jgi:hypothetical protein
MPAGIPATAVEVLTPTSQMLSALVNDAGFRLRFTGQLETIAAQYLNTAIGSGVPVVTAGHQAYARLVVANPDQYANTLIKYFIHRTNLSGANIWVDLSTGTPNLYLDATDAAIAAQLNTDWPSISGA